MRLAVSALLVAGLAPVGCAEDKILRVDQVCGNGKREGTEECDFLPDASGAIGCVNCHIAPGFTCGDTGCEATCGDGKIAAPLEDCDPPDGKTCDSSCRAGTKAEPCDMTGYWIMRQTTFSIDNLLNNVQTTSDWTAYKITQTGTTFQVDRAIACGLHVSGSTTVFISDSALRGLMHANPQGASTPAPRAARKGTFQPSASGNTCDFAMDRLYKVRGVVESQYLPADPLSKPALSTLPQLPWEDDPLNPTGAHLAGQVDIDNDGNPGLAYIMSGNITGERHVVQRDWTEYFSNATFTIAQNALEFVARANFDDQENILKFTNCPSIGCNWLNVGAQPSATLNHRAVFQYLGKDLADPRVSRIIVREIEDDLDADMITCANVRRDLPHDPTKQ